MFRDIEAARGRARDGGLMTAADAERAFQLSIAFEKLERASKSVFKVIGAALAPAFTPVLNALTSGHKALAEWVKNNESLVQAVGWSVAGLALLAAGIAGVVTAVTIGGSVIAGFVAAIKAIVGTIVAAFGLLTSPITVVIGLIAGLGYWWATSTETGQRAINHLRGVFQNASAFMGTVWGGVVDAIKAGDLGLAARVGMAGIKLAWNQVMDYLAARYSEFDKWFASEFGISFSDVIAGIKTAWVEAMAFLRSAWVLTVNAFQVIGEAIGNWIGDWMNDLNSISPDVALTSRLQARGSQRVADLERAADITRQFAEIEARRLAGLHAIELGRGANPFARGPDDGQDWWELEAALHEAATRRAAVENRFGDPDDGTMAAALGQGVRGTFNGGVAFGLAGPGVSPVVAAVDRGNELMRQNNQLMQQVAAANAQINDGIRHVLQFRP